MIIKIKTLTTITLITLTLRLITKYPLHHNPQSANTNIYRTSPITVMEIIIMTIQSLTTTITIPFKITIQV